MRRNGLQTRGMVRDTEEFRFALNVNGNGNSEHESLTSPDVTIHISNISFT